MPSEHSDVPSLTDPVSKSRVDLPPTRVDPEHHSRWIALRGLITSQLLAWSEKRYAARTSRELLRLYRAIATLRPDLAGRDLYRLVVMERARCDAPAADAILEDAEESFAAWPARRELTLGDVVHYLAVAEFLASHHGEHWIHADIGRVVASRIPHELRAVHKSTT